MNKESEPILTILTPTYNRCDLLPKLYQSLQKQTNKNFQWLVIDDGSTDNTGEYMKNIHEDNFIFEYHYKTNGGKHTALNYAHKYIKGEFVCIVDSDDFLTEDAVEVIENDWNKYRDNNNIGIISYQKGGIHGETISKTAIAPDYYISDHIHFRVNHWIGGDCAEVVRASLIKKYPFPVLQNECFLSESWLWNNLAQNYQTVYRRKTIYICEYLAGGLTKSGRALRMHNPLGMMTDCKGYFLPSISVLVQIKEMLLYGVYALCSSKSLYSSMKNSQRFFRMILILPFSYMIWLYWSWKYEK